MTFEGQYRWGAALILLAALLYLVAIALGGSITTFGLTAIFYALLGFGLLRGMRWLAYIAFISVFIGLSGALLNLTSGGPLFAALAVVNGLAAIALFIALWRPAAPKAA